MRFIRDITLCTFTDISHVAFNRFHVSRSVKCWEDDRHPIRRKLVLP